MNTVFKVTLYLRNNPAVIEFQVEAPDKANLVNYLRSDSSRFEYQGLLDQYISVAKNHIIGFVVEPV